MLRNGLHRVVVVKCDGLIIYCAMLFMVTNDICIDKSLNEHTQTQKRAFHVCIETKKIFKWNYCFALEYVKQSSYWNY